MAGKVPAIPPPINNYKTSTKYKKQPCEDTRNHLVAGRNLRNIYSRKATTALGKNSSSGAFCPRELHSSPRSDGQKPQNFTVKGEVTAQSVEDLDILFSKI